MTNFLDGIAIRFFRSIGPQTQFIGPFTRMNFFIGANNAGKSAILNVIDQHLASLVNDEPLKVTDPVNIYRGKESGTFLIAIGRNKDIVIEELKKDLELHSREEMNRSQDKSLRCVVNKLSRNGMIYTTKEPGSLFRIIPDVDVEEAVIWSNDWQWISENLGRNWDNLTGFAPRNIQKDILEDVLGYGAGNDTQWVTDTLKSIANFSNIFLPDIYLIPAKRQLGSKGETFDDLSGRGLIDHLASLQNPQWNKQDDRTRFEYINSFVRDVTGKPDAQLEVPSDREHLLVHMDNKVLPLSALGTGIHEVVLIAAFCTIHDGSLMCIEEPEICLHPLLQRKLVNYLIKNTKSQYFVATHSSAFINTPESSIFRVTNDGEQTLVTSVLTQNGQRMILDDLGCQASDLLQSNAVIWVEGPSDRTYINHWLSSYDERLVEGVHYNIMFYGGDLVSHLTTSDEDIDKFINLRELNRNMAMVLDSDRSAATDSLKPNVKRLISGRERSEILFWITEGREIENYVEGAILEEALMEIHPRIYFKAGKTGKFDHAYYFMQKNPENPGHCQTFKDVDKAKLAKIICGYPAKLDILDLKKRILELRNMVLKANGMEVCGD